jgi:hypothetical protein
MSARVACTSAVKAVAVDISSLPIIMLAVLLCQVAADAITRWLYPQLDPQLRLLDLSSDAQQHKDFLAGWIDLLSTTPKMMPFDKVGCLTWAAFLPASGSLYNAVSREGPTATIR